MPCVHDAERVLVGATGALVIHFGFRSGVVNGPFQAASGAGDAAGGG